MMHQECGCRCAEIEENEKTVSALGARIDELERENFQLRQAKDFPFITARAMAHAANTHKKEEEFWRKLAVVYSTALKKVKEDLAGLRRATVRAGLYGSSYDIDRTVEDVDAVLASPAKKEEG